jgi:hypothetical protein
MIQGWCSIASEAPWAVALQSVLNPFNDSLIPGQNQDHASSNPHTARTPFAH